jgi:hypothetical protein
MRAGLKNHAQPERFSWFGAVRTEHWLPSLLDRQAGSQTDGAPPEVELKQERSDEREVELEGDARRALGQPVAAPHEAFHPAEKYSTFPALVLARSDAYLFVSLRGFN